MKKIILAIISIIMATFMFVGCGESVKPLDNVSGEVLSGNGSFAVEKGDYVYFINGIEEVTKENKFGEVEKAQLVRVKTSELSNPKTAKIETVIPKLFITASYTTGVYIYGDYVYFATPSDRKDKQSNVLNDQTLFYRFNLKTGKADSKHIAIATDNTTEYRFVESNGTVYLMFVNSEKVDDSTTNKTLVVYNADTREEVMTSFVYKEMLMAEDNSNSVYLTKFGRDEVNEADESFHELYKYTVGEKEAKLVLSGAPSNRPNIDEDKRIEDNLQGATFTLVKNNGEYLIYKQQLLDSKNESISYNYIKADGVKGIIGGRNKYLDEAFTKNSYVKSINEVYYVDTTDTIGCFVKFNYEKINDKDLKNGIEIVCDEVKGYTLQFVENGYAYFSDSEGFYYRCDLEGNNFSKINGIAMKSSSNWYAPRVIGNYFLGVYGDDLYASYVYCVDMTNINNAEEYDKYLEDVVVDDKEHVIKLHETLVGKMSDADKTAFDEAVEKKYKED